ncbi:MAG: hypothetical protein LBP75_00085 [Planctomycetota bacterium]|jgi:methylphosphotriester-DNA--protein-cysteine methyltransferase|nr:hypothetical protein [Planctomycetota bacterium]
MKKFLLVALFGMAVFGAVAPAGETSPTAASDAAPEFHGNRNSRVFHSAVCPDFDCYNCTVIFPTAQAALDAGFRPHRECCPEIKPRFDKKVKPAATAKTPAAEKTAPEFHGNQRSQVFHSAVCPDFNCYNCTVIFPTAQAVLDAGFRPHRECVYSK